MQVLNGPAVENWGLRERHEEETEEKKRYQVSSIILAVE